MSPRSDTPAITEAQFERRVIDAARVHGWMVVHFRAALTRSGRWATPLQGDRGFPDLVLARRGVVLMAELKSDTGRPGPGQREWAEAIGPALHRWWRPSMWPDVERELRTLGKEAA